jgi:hypothetical protein
MNATPANHVDAARSARRGDGSALASFLCPVCFQDALLEEIACPHLLLVQDRWGDVYCRDLRVRTLARESEAAVGGRGPDAVERLCERLGPNVVLYELVEPDALMRSASVFFVVDVSEAASGSGRGVAG